MTQSKYEELYHHGIKGQKWGIRRFQNKDGSLTNAGRKRERDADDYKSHKTKRLEKAADRAQKDINSYESIRGKDLTAKNGKLIATKDDIEEWRNASVEQKNKINERLKESRNSDKQKFNKDGSLTRTGSAVKIGATAVATALAVYGAYKLSEIPLDRYYEKVFNDYASSIQIADAKIDKAISNLNAASNYMKNTHR